ncbi:hypothetical protein [Halorussus caseinilyticus]|uniref:Uncharacterized protein n=1 Tax=Halorussus caseinilyticus TaxID=3034025 RepID=A0ABD5WN42_9EURY
MRLTTMVELVARLLRLKIKNYTQKRLKTYATTQRRRVRRTLRRTRSESTVLTRLDAIESKLDAKVATETVTAQVLSGDGQTFLQVLDETDLPPGQMVELQIREATSEDDSSS